MKTKIPREIHPGMVDINLFLVLIYFSLRIFDHKYHLPKVQGAGDAMRSLRVSPLGLSTSWLEQVKKYPGTDVAVPDSNEVNQDPAVKGLV